MKFVQVIMYEYRDEEAGNAALDYMQDDVGMTFSDDLTITRFIVPDGDEHVIDFTPDGYTTQHPIRERAKGELFACSLHARAGTAWMLQNLGQGRYRVTEEKNHALRFERVDD